MEDKYWEVSGTCSNGKGKGEGKKGKRENRMEIKRWKRSFCKWREEGQGQGGKQEKKNLDILCTSTNFL